MHLMGRGWSILAKPSGLPLRGENPKQGLSPKAGPSDGVGGTPQDQEEGRGDCWLGTGPLGLPGAHVTAGLSRMPALIQLTRGGAQASAFLATPGELLWLGQGPHFAKQRV